jgi:hypothetical protein
MYPIFNGFSFRKEKKNYPIFINYQLIVIRSLRIDYDGWEVIGPSLIKGFKKDSNSGKDFATERQIGIRNPKSVGIRRIRVIRVPFNLMNTISSIQQRP